MNLADELLNLYRALPKDVLNIPEKDALRKQYLEADPFPHLVIDDFIKPEVLELMQADIDAQVQEFSVNFDDDFQINKSISRGDKVGHALSMFASKLANSETIKSLEKLTDIPFMIADPYYNTEYGYYHMMKPGGLLGSHVDQSHHAKLNIPHVLNIVIYVSKEWNEEDGGAICLYDKTGKNVVKKVPCVYNRAVIFGQSPISYHGVEPISKEAQGVRHSLYFAYYSVADAQRELEFSFPQMGDKDGLNHDVKYATHFALGGIKDLARSKNKSHLRPRLRYLFNLFAPPILYKTYRKIFNA